MERKILMDENEFSFEALLKNGEFKIYESEKLLAAFKNLNDVLESYITDTVIRSKIESAALNCSLEAQHGSFKQGFYFAIKSIKFMLKI